MADNLSSEKKLQYELDIKNMKITELLKENQKLTDAINSKKRAEGDNDISRNEKHLSNLSAIVHNNKSDEKRDIEVLSIGIQLTEKDQQEGEEEIYFKEVNNQLLHENDLLKNENGKLKDKIGSLKKSVEIIKLKLDTEIKMQLDKKDKIIRDQRLNIQDLEK